jgi:glycerol-3-phosphate acyltransferase PlsX
VPTIAVDTLGAGNALVELVRAGAEISTSTDIECLLVGDEAHVQAELDQLEYAPERIAVAHASDADPSARDGALGIALRAVADGRADALVSAGSSRACIAACQRLLRPLGGGVPPALAAVIPRQTAYPGQDPLALLLDVGATPRADADALVHYAVMGSAWACGISKVQTPRVALLGMGPQTLDDDAVLGDVAKRLMRDPRVSFVGAIEGGALLRGDADVIVCEGLTGRVVRTLFEDVSTALLDVTRTAGENRLSWRLGIRLLAEGIERVRALTDYARYGGAPILGFERVVVTCHAHSNARVIVNAVKVAAKAVRDGVPEAIVHAVEGGPPS